MKHVSIKNWAVEDRPREKWLSAGKRNLSNAELLSLIIRTGRTGQTALDISKYILRFYGNKLEQLSQASAEDFTSFKGIGKAKAIQIAAVFEIANRLKSPIIVDKKIVSSDSAFKSLGFTLSNLKHEEFWIIMLNRANHIIRSKCISKGGVSGTVVDVRLILKSLIENLASSVILVHNHPSGNLQPSAADKQITKKLKEALQAMDIQVLDHLIVFENKYFSFADEGIL